MRGSLGSEVWEISFEQALLEMGLPLTPDVVKYG